MARVFAPQVQNCLRLVYRGTNLRAAGVFLVAENYFEDG
jgi:hypothetical protein